ncbi:bifunctional lytic transglycosylase/C40 family peptidase [Actinomadura barringtoniae]|uniref:Bifunctional lytic transglycosylase/C40 family peptidase n=1 Tax=Actinomadura barringtoniae TaxID=1427535 RepID=A0A939P7B9_9ACTN|nr:bifunctional lytic transglycosylase/C40 family peptidase [Actinomadura barringtoniae]MBO2446863.1 bifunctional lytic transglycosylase/C40 family peptidase [Actinomadura barringtoniae]
MNRRRVLIGVALGAVGMLFVALMIVPVLFGASQFMYGNGASNAGCVDVSDAGIQPGEANDARAIPANYLQLYKKAGQDYGIPWNVLAGIGKVETSHGTSKLPGVSSGENYAGAGGPMQFLQATFDSFAVDGNKDHKKDRYDPADAIPTAAAYLKHNGAPQRMKTAIFMYNHSWDYVNLVLDWAKKYGGGDFKVVQSNGIDCQDNQLPPGLSGLVARIVAFAMSQRGKPYVFGANGPDAWDCSSLIQAAYRAAGISIPRATWGQYPFGVRVPKGQEQPGDLVFFNSGPGTSADHPGHVGMVIGKNKMIVARCTLCDPAIGVFPYKRGDWVGVTRPLARPDIQKKLSQLNADAAAQPGG